MKIIVIAPTSFFANRGTHIRILEESIALENRGNIIDIVTYNIGDDIDKNTKTRINVYRIPNILFWYKKLEAGPNWQKIILDILLFWKVLTLTVAKKHEIIHAHLHEGVFIGWFVQKILFWRKMKLVSDLHGSMTKEMISHNYLKSKPVRRLFIQLEKFIENSGDFVVTSSWQNSKRIKLTRKDKKVRTVLDGVNLNVYKNLPAKKALKKELNFPRDKLIVTYCGSFVKNKGIKYLLKAIPFVLKKDLTPFFVIAGYPVSEINNLLDNKYRKHIRLISPLSYFDLHKILGASDVAIEPKSEDTNQASGKILNYMGAGLPVVCFDNDNNRHYLGEGGYYCNKANSEGIADGIFFFLKNPLQVKIKGVLNKRKSKTYSWLKSAKQIEDIYKYHII